MSGSDKRKLAELSIVFGIPAIMVGKNKTSNTSLMKTLQKKLQKLVIPELVPVSERISKAEIQEVDEQIVTWFKDCGWWERPRSAAVLISFCLDMIENSPITYNPMIMKTLKRMAEHLENSKKLKYSDIVYGTEIAQKWQEIYHKENTWQDQKD